jgi:hypothetical protein
MASLAEVAVQEPGLITDMFIHVGTNLVNGKPVDVYAVRIFEDGTARYLTVDTHLPAGGGHYAGVPGGVLWAALAEKAYAQANGAGWVETGDTDMNSYEALAYGWPSWALPALTGEAAREHALDDFTESEVVQAFQAGRFVVLCTDDPDSDLIVGSHCYALVGYDPTSSKPFKVYNPWRKSTVEDEITTDSDGSQYYGGVFNAEWDFVDDNFSDVSLAGAAPGAGMWGAGEGQARRQAVDRFFAEGHPACWEEA